jgi:hypothetical protein
LAALGFAVAVVVIFFLFQQVQVFINNNILILPEIQSIKQSINQSTTATKLFYKQNE